MGKPVVAVTGELVDRIKAVLNNPEHELAMYDLDDPEAGSEVTKVAVVEIVDREWCTTQEWWEQAEPRHGDFPTHLVRVMTLSNTGWNFLLQVDGDEIRGWYMDELAGNAPGYQGCYEYEGGYSEDGEGMGAMINDPEALAWVDGLYEQYEDAWV